jgi:hypothetical protein
MFQRINRILDLFSKGKTMDRVYKSREPQRRFGAWWTHGWDGRLRMVLGHFEGRELTVVGEKERGESGGPHRWRVQATERPVWLGSVEQWWQSFGVRHHGGWSGKKVKWSWESSH